MGLTEEELPDIVQRWRSANPRIRDLWYAVEEASLQTMLTAQPHAINGLIFALESDLVYGQHFLTVQLPSGRKLFLPETIFTGESVRESGDPLLYCRSADKEMGSDVHLWWQNDREYRAGNRKRLSCGNITKN